ncbi:MAG: hypothetical protein V4526_01400 [Patescibacteria group bacterium]
MRIRSLNDLEKLAGQRVFFLRYTKVVSAVIDRTEPPERPDAISSLSEWTVHFTDVQGAFIFKNFYYLVSFLGWAVSPFSERHEAEAAAAQRAEDQRLELEQMSHQAEHANSVLAESEE